MLHLAKITAGMYTLPLQENAVAYSKSFHFSIDITNAKYIVDNMSKKTDDLKLIRLSYACTVRCFEM